MSKRKIRMTVNGKLHTLALDPGRFLLDVLRSELGLTGAKLVCDLGVCGACTVMLNGRTVNSCLTLALEADGGEVTTIEGLAAAGALTPVQRAFVDHGGLQCGYCTPGMVIAATALLARTTQPDDAEIREALAGNLCRCTGYVKIFDAVAAAAREVAR